MCALTHASIRALGGLFLVNPAHDEVRPDVIGAAIFWSVSFRKGTIVQGAVTKDRVFQALVVGSCRPVLAHYSPSALTLLRSFWPARCLTFTRSRNLLFCQSP